MSLKIEKKNHYEIGKKKEVIVREEKKEENSSD